MKQVQQPFYEGRRVWVIGASSGIGEALSLALASLGANVTASARNREALAALELKSKGKIKAFPLDVAEEGALASAFDSLNQSGELPDTVIFVAAYYQPTQIDEIESNDLERTIRVNLWAAIELCRLITPSFYERGSGQIALVGSVAGYRGLPKGQPYSATKAGLINLAESLYLEAKPKGVDVKLINPGFVQTPMTDKNQFVMPDIITPEEAAKCIAIELSRSGFEIHFPKKFTRKLKLLALLPYRLYFSLTQKL